MNVGLYELILHATLGIFTEQGVIIVSLKTLLTTTVPWGMSKCTRRLLCPSYFVAGLNVRAGKVRVKVDFCLAVVPETIGL